MWINKEGRLHWRFGVWGLIFEVLLGRFAFRMALSGDCISLAIPLFTIYISWNDNSDKEISFYIYEWTIWWNLWTSTMEWSSKTPRWRHGCWCIPDTFLGRKKYLREIIEERTVQIPMPEGCYEANIKLCKDTWKRPLWFADSIMRIDADIPKGIPHSGKGENSWDCGEDGCFGMCCPANTIAEGVGEIVGSVLKDRVRYGGWQEWNYHKSIAR